MLIVQRLFRNFYICILSQTHMYPLFLQFPFMNGITIMNGTALGKRTINSAKIQRNAKDISNNERSDDADENGEFDRNKIASAGNIQAMQLSSAPTTKCRIQLKDVIDLVGSNDHDIKLLKVSTIESRY